MELTVKEVNVYCQRHCLLLDHFPFYRCSSRDSWVGSFVSLRQDVLGSILWIILLSSLKCKKLHFEFRIKDTPHFRRVGSLKVSAYVLTFYIPQSAAQIRVQITLAVPRQTDALQAGRRAAESEGMHSHASSISGPSPGLHLLGVEAWGQLS